MPAPSSRRPDAATLVALAAALALAVGLLWTLQATLRVDRHEEVRVIDAWAEVGRFTYDPTGPSGPLPPGEPGYFVADAPELHVRFHWHLDDADAERATALASLRLVVEQEQRPAWTYEAEIGSATFTGTPAEGLALDGVVDFPATQARIAETPGRRLEGARWTVVADVRFASVPEESHAASSSTFEFPIAYHAPLYVLPDEGPTVKDHTSREVSVYDVRPGLAGLLAAPAGPALVLLGIVLLRWALPRVDQEAAPWT